MAILTTQDLFRRKAGLKRKEMLTTRTLIERENARIKELKAKETEAKNENE